MPIPADILRQTKLLTGMRDNDRLARVETAYRRVLAQLMQVTEWMVEIEPLAGVADLSILTPRRQIVRVLAVLYEDTVLDKVTAWSLDIRNTRWQLSSPSAPEVWLWNQIPQSLNGQLFVGAEQIAVAPPVPNPPGRFLLIEAIQPADDAVLPPWLVHLVALRLAADLLQTLIEEQEAPDPQVATAQLQFYTLVGDLWQQSIGKLIPA